MACLTEEVAAVLQQTGDVLSSLVEGSHGSASQNTDLALPSLFRAFQGIRERAAEDQCTLAVLALAKSGKSTLVNAVLGSAVLPSNNVPETARICAIQHTPTAPGPRLAYQTPDGQTVQVEGAGGIREHLRQLNAMGRDGRQGMVADEQPLSIAMPIAALAATPADALSSRITILDTPGPNEAGEDHLRFKVERLMEGVDAVLYILDWSKLKTNEETAMLQRLHELNPGVVRRLCHRCFFVVNKLDLAESSEGMGGEETREYVAALVTSQLNVPGFELLPEQVFLVSARDALRSRLALRPAAAADDLDAFRKVAFGKHWGRVTDPETIRETAVEMLEASGLPELETRVLGFLGRRAALLHLVAVLDDVERLLAQVHNLASASVASLHQGVAALSATVGSLQGRLAATLAQFDDVRREVQELEGLVVDEVRERMGRLRHRLVDQIHQVLNPATLPTGVSHGRWPAAWSMTKAILRMGRPGRRAAEGPLEGEQGEQELQMKLSELHSMIYLQIEAETKEFWHSLEQATNQRQRQLFGAINRRLGELSRAIEADVGGCLSCTLEPVHMQLKPPTAEQFHVNLQQLLRKGIQMEVSQEVTEVTREHVVYEKRTRDSMCKKFEWWEPTTQTRTEQLAVTRERYTADPEAIQAYFLGVVDETITNSVTAVRRYVGEYLADRLGEARGRLAAYAERYAAVMEDALATARLGEAERAAALQAAEAHSAAVGGLLDDVQQLQQRAEEMLEGWDGELEADEEPPAVVPAASTVAALAELQGGLLPALGDSPLTASGSTAAEVAAAYAAQQVAALELSMSALGLDGGGGATGEAQPADTMAEVALEAEASGGSMEPPTLVAGSEGEEEDGESGDWTVVSDAEPEDEGEASDAGPAAVEA